MVAVATREGAPPSVKRPHNQSRETATRMSNSRMSSTARGCIAAHPLLERKLMASQRAEALPHSRPPAVALYWGVVLVWMATISFFSTEPFSAANTSRYLDPVLRYFFPHITPAQFISWHFVIRKSAHFIEFFVLGALAYWASRRGRLPRWRPAWMLQALGLAVLYSFVDEAHQVFVPNRTSSLYDSGIDSLGAAASQIIIYLRHGLLARLAPPR